MMSRKDYILIADAIQDVYRTATEEERVGLIAVTSVLASRLAGDNYRFDRNRFYRRAIAE